MSKSVVKLPQKNIKAVWCFYQVETIGDAYMIVGGVPTPNPRHTHEVAGFALDMVVKAAEVKSPATGKPLQVIKAHC